MNTFEEYINKVDATAVELDAALEKAKSAQDVRPRYYDKREYYNSLGDEVLGDFKCIHPSTDNLFFAANLDLDQALEFLQSSGWSVIESKQNQNVGLRWSPDNGQSKCFRLLGETGLPSLYLWNDPGETYLFRSDSDDDLASTFQTIERARYFKVNKDPDHRIKLVTAMPLNPYGHLKSSLPEPDRSREGERIMERAVVQLMRKMIQEKVDAIFHTRGTWPKCVFNVSTP